MRLKTEALQDHLNKISKGCAVMERFRSVLERWVELQPILVERNLKSAMNIDSWFRRDRIAIHIPTATEKHIFYVNAHNDIVFDWDILEWDKIQGIFDKNGKSVLNRFKGSLIQASLQEDGVGLIGQIVLANPRPQATGERHFCKVIGAPTTNFIEKNLNMLQKDIEKFAGSYFVGSSEISNPLVEFKFNRTTEHLNGRSTLVLTLYYQPMKIVVNKHYPEVEIITIVNKFGKATTLGQNKFFVKIKDIEIVEFDSLISAVIQNITSL